MDYMNPIGQARDQNEGAWLIGFSAVIGISACVGDLVMTYLLGTWYPGYKPLLQPMSDLGDVGSPVGFVTTVWWAAMGLLFLIFGYGFYKAFSRYGTPAKAAGWMFALYGIGEGFGSGLAQRIPGQSFFAPATVAHNLSGAVGVAAAVSLPFIIMKICTPGRSTRLYWYSWMTTIAGTLFLGMFGIAFFLQPAASWISYAGMWQRLFMLTYYVFFICLAVLMITRYETAPAPTSHSNRQS